MEISKEMLAKAKEAKTYDELDYVAGGCGGYGGYNGRPII